jgi:hypothetical protein
MQDILRLNFDWAKKHINSTDGILHAPTLRVGAPYRICVTLTNADDVNRDLSLFAIQCKIKTEDGQELTLSSPDIITTNKGFEFNLLVPTLLSLDKPTMQCEGNYTQLSFDHTIYLLSNGVVSEYLATGTGLIVWGVGI